MVNTSLVSIEQILDDLDDLAGSTVADQVFYGKILSQGMATVGASSLGIAIPALDSNWVMRGRVGEVPASLESSVLQHLQSSPASFDSSLIEGSDAGKAWYGVPISRGNAAKGVLVATFESKLSQSSRDGLQEVMAAFAEIISERQTRTLDLFLTHDLSKVQDTCRGIGSSESFQDAGQALVNGLASLLQECRVSLCEAKSFGACKPLAISSVASPNPKSPAYHEISEIAKQVIKQRKTVMQQTDDSPDAPASESTGNYLFIPFQENRNAIPRWVLGLEFANVNAYAKGVSKLPYLLPSLNTAWDQKERWLAVPAIARAVPTHVYQWRSTFASLLKLGVALSLIAGLAFLLLRPKPLLIEAEGALLPTDAKSIFATADGFLAELMVVDNQLVDQGQLLVKLKSPDLELQLEQIQGEQRALQEEARGIQIAMNQIDPTASDVLNQQSLMASQLTDISIQQDSLKQQLGIINQQIQDLEVRSPIHGMVIGRDLKQNLQGRPVNRGELLFRIMDLSSKWEVRLQVSDLDAGYVLEHYRQVAGNEEKTFEYLLDSSPNNTFEARVASIANRVENLHREGTFLEVRAGADGLPEGALRVGSNVHAYFDCGTYPSWFVWFRPLIETAQRKFWL